MKVTQFTLALVVLSFVFAIRLSAQQTEANQKLLDELKTKAEKGDAISQAGLGEVYYFGELGLSNNFVEALKWFQKAS